MPTQPSLQIALHQIRVDELNAHINAHIVAEEGLLVSVLNELVPGFQEAFAKAKAVKEKAPQD
jgi:N-acetylmuramoyl-L-alanine amidase